MTSPSPAPDRTGRAPVPVLVAAALTALEGAAFLGYAGWLAPNLRSNRLEVGLTALLFFVAYALFLGLCAWQLTRLRSWARAPIVLAQLIQGMVGLSFWGGQTTPVALALIGVALAVLVAIFHPRSIEALGATS